MELPPQRASVASSIRLWVFRIAGWWFVIFGGIGIVMFAIGLALSLFGPNAEDFGPWWAQALAIALLSLFMAIGRKAIRLKSTKDLESEDAVLKRRVAQVASWLSQHPPKP